MIMINLIFGIVLAVLHLNPAEQATITKTHDQIALKLAPSAKQKLQRVSQSLANAPNAENAARLGITNAFPGVNFSDSDISALIVFVMWEATKDADNDLKNLMDELKKINDKKAALRSATVAQSDVAKKKLDSLNEMSEMTGLRLQMMMDKRSKFISTLSNIMKKISSTQNTVVQNLK